MNIVIYRSRDSKIFLNSHFTEELQSKLRDIHNINITTEENKQLNLDKIIEADLVIFFSHGDLDEICHKFIGPNNRYNESLIDSSNINILKDKRVLVFSCYTASELGQLAIKEGCTVYFGFKGKINRDLPSEILELKPELTNGGDPRQLISSVYSEVFNKLIYRAITENLTFDQFEKMMKLGLNKYMMSRLRLEKSIPFKFHAQGAQPVKDTIKTMVIHGDSSIKFVS
ncbi:hypothetical protein P4597_15445 [Peribacillus simplex]|uniref:hypothetical protein n=1 Tax=Peribacillus simplex TaxID=1478 RepID=UPI002E1B4B87|nr:hypothetical protein [Peribacillus simplex]